MATLYLVGVSLPNGEEEKIPVKRMGRPVDSGDEHFVDGEYDYHNDLVHIRRPDSSVEHYSIGE